MTSLYVDGFIVLAVASAAVLAASGAGLLALTADAQAPADTPTDSFDDLRAIRTALAAVAHGVFDAGVFAFLSPMIALVVLVFLATLVPVLFFMVPFFVAWAIQTHGEHRRDLLRKWSDVATA